MRISQLIAVTVCLQAATYADSYDDYDKSIEQSQQDEDYFEDDKVDIKRNFSEFIVGGGDVNINTWPWVAAIYRVHPQGFIFHCAATLVSSKHLVSAAHCFKSDFMHPHKYFVFLARFTLTSWTPSMQDNSVVKDVTSIKPHPLYIASKGRDADLAILTLRSEVNSSLLVAPIRLVSSKQSTLRRDGTIFGWGRTEDAPISNQPLQAELRGQSQQACLDDHARFKYIITDNFFCAGTNQGVGPCNGDSGGGYFFKRQNKKLKTQSWRLQGVISKSVTLHVDEDLPLLTCTKNNYFLFTDLTKFLPWIYQVLEGIEDTAVPRVKYMYISDDVTGPVTCRSADFKHYEDEQERNFKVLEAVQQTADLSQQMTSRLLQVKKRYQDQTSTLDLIVRILKNNVEKRTLNLPWETVGKFVSVLPQSVQNKVYNVVDYVVREDALVSDKVKVSSVVIAEFFLKTGARLDAQDVYSRSPLLVAAWHGHLSVVKWLINELHANVKHRDYDDRNVLHCAALSGNLDLVRWLLNNTDVDVESRDALSQTPLHYATKHQPVLQYLVTQAKADVNVTDDSGCTVLCYAARHGSLQSVKWLVREQHLDVNARDNDGESILHHAARHVNIVKYLVQAGANVYIKNNEQQTLLHKAAYWGHFHTVQWLLGNTDLNVNTQDVDGDIALLLATRDLDTVKYFVQAGANVHIKNNNQQTVLHKAAYWGHVHTVQWLLGNTDLNINSQDLDGNTALLLATEDLDTVKYLVQAGADVNIKNNKQQTVLHVAADDWRHYDTVQWLLGNTDINVNNQDVDGNTALHMATRHLAALRYLVQAGADVHIKNNKQQTVLHAAANWGDSATMQWLLGNTYINVNSKDEDGNTALHMATRHSYTVKLLVEIGKANILLKNNVRQNVLDKARKDLQQPINRGYYEEITKVIAYLIKNTNMG